MSLTNNSRILLLLLSLSLVTVAIGQACSDQQLGKSGGHRIVCDFPKPEPEMRRFASCSDIVSWADSRKKEWDAENKRYQSWLSTQTGPRAISSMADAGAPNSSEIAGITNQQESGVTEGDRAVVDANHLYVAQSSTVQIVSRQSKAVVASIETSGLRNLQLYSSVPGRLLIVGTKETAISPNDRDPISEIGSSDAASLIARVDSMIVVRSYRILPGSAPKLLAERMLRGAPVGTRLIGNRLFIVARGFQLVSKDGECGDVYRPLVNDFDLNATGIASFDAGSDALSVKTTAFSGAGDAVYVSKTAIYIVKSSLQWFSFDDRRSGWDTSAIIRVAIDESGEMRPENVALVDGRIKNQWALKELSEQKSLAIATSLRSTKIANRLSVFSYGSGPGVMPLRSRTEDFGLTEDIRSVRYIGKIAYVVTFRVTDPLYAIDLSNPDKVSILGELKVPGFSAYLHDAGDGRLIGVGYSGAGWRPGVQVSVFDVRSPTDLRTIDQKIIADHGVGLPLENDHHAFFYDSIRDRIFVPMDGGAAVVKLSPVVSVKARLSHAPMTSKKCRKDIERAFELDGSLVTTSVLGVRFHDVELPDNVKSEIRFKNGEDECYAY